MGDLWPRNLQRYRIEPVSDLNILVSSGDDSTSSSTAVIGPTSAGVFVGWASAMPNFSSTALVYVSCVNRIVSAFAYTLDAGHSQEEFLIS